MAELPSDVAQCKTEADEAALRKVMYANLVMEPAADAARFVRRAKRVIKSPVGRDFLRDELALAGRVQDRLRSLDRVSADAIRTQVRADRSLGDALARQINAADAKAKGLRVLAGPLNNLQRASDVLDGMDAGILSHLPPADARSAGELLDAISARVEKMRELLPRS